MMRTGCRAHTPLGVFTALYENGVINRVLFPSESPGAQPITYDDTLPFAQQMEEYLSGKRKEFTLPILIPGTPFRQDVYRATLNIPYGETATYADVAFIAGYPRAMRAVGSAMKATQLPILIPCHRVVHKSPGHSAYRGGTDIKTFLLSLEEKYKLCGYAYER